MELKPLQSRAFFLLFARASECPPSRIFEGLNPYPTVACILHLLDYLTFNGLHSIIWLAGV